MTTPDLADLTVVERMRMLREALLPVPDELVEASPISLEVLKADHRELLRRIDWLGDQLTSVKPRASVHENPFTSSVPILGGLIIRLRYAWNWMSTKWWVLPMLTQQNRFNHDVIGALQETQLLLRSTSHLISQMADMEAERQAEVAQLRAELVAMRYQVPATSHSAPQQE